ncbi:alkyl hydroperoxide reductase subunit F (plasmid) [Sinorhizobium americanum]|uniref:Alkyl hydroperoxide reductase subunit F n=1 Tax=Sinorhizobium americanum TaxID=194963 RepID=A0A1L3LU73_9HYPH|nr:alkyl hydroperoxide reductase subunit F [Sinorhizobium americanum CCGM7]APG93644.1 alkyl hydroperoxide reductase subunit F [Sinorhizobium americanum]
MHIENFISLPQTEGPSFSSALEAHVKENPVEIVKSQRVEKLVSTGRAHELRLSSGGTLSAKTVILATGARWRQMGVEIPQQTGSLLPPL